MGEKYREDEMDEVGCEAREEGISQVDVGAGGWGGGGRPEGQLCSMATHGRQDSASPPRASGFNCVPPSCPNLHSLRAERTASCAIILRDFSICLAISTGKSQPWSLP